MKVPQNEAKLRSSLLENLSTLLRKLDVSGVRYCECTLLQQPFAKEVLAHFWFDEREGVAVQFTKLEYPPT
jgi:hypothetical protein